MSAPAGVAGGAASAPSATIAIPRGGGVSTALLRRPCSPPDGVLRPFATPDVVVDEDDTGAVWRRHIGPGQGGEGADAGDGDVEICLEKGRKSGDPPAPFGVLIGGPRARPARAQSTTPPRAQ